MIISNIPEKWVSLSRNYIVADVGLLDNVGKAPRPILGIT